MTKTIDIQRFSPQALEFDRQNPRMPEFDITASSTDEDIIRVLWDEMDVEELVLSISATGFFSHEPVIVTQEESGKNIVIEGNRRLAAIKLLLDPELATSLNVTVGEISKEVRKTLDEISVIMA